MGRFYLLAVFFVGISLCKAQLDLNTLEEQFSSIPGLENFNKSAVPSQEEIENVIREKCKKNGGEDAFDHLLNEVTNVQECITNNVNSTAIMEELEEARKTGSMDEVFGKQCKKNPIIFACIRNLTSKLENCLEREEKDTVKVIMNITESLATFLCFKDGDRLAMFIAEGGLECLEDKRDQLQQCANKTISKQISSNYTINNLPLLVINDQTCTSFDEMHDCAVEELEDCKDNTPANIMDALFKYIRRILPCKHPKVKSSARVTYLADSTTVNSQPMTNLLSSTGEIIEMKCKRYADEQTLKEVKEKTVEFRQCAQQNFKQLIKGENTCEIFSINIRKCSRSLLSKIKPCFSPEESYIPSLAMESLKEGLSYLCERRGMNFQGLFNMQGLECAMNRDKVEVDDCYKLSNSNRIRQGSEIILTKEVFCSDAKRMTKCIDNYIEEECGKIRYFHANVTKFFKAVNKPCKNFLSSASKTNSIGILTLGIFVLLRVFL